MFFGEKFRGFGIVNDRLEQVSVTWKEREKNFIHHALQGILQVSIQTNMEPVFEKKGIFRFNWSAS